MSTVGHARNALAMRRLRRLRCRPAAGAGRARQPAGYDAAMTRRLASSRPDELVRAERDIRARIGDLPLDLAAMSAISNIYRAASTVRHHLEQKVLSDENLSWAAFTVLWVLWIWGEQETGQVAAEAGVTKGTLTGVLDRKSVV